MLAPRKKLWSTPPEVIDKSIELLSLSDSDVCFDIGCGDGRFLFRACEISPVGTVVGIEIDEARCSLLSNKIGGSAHTSRCKVICGNALEQDYSEATCFFLYLIPRGLKIVYKNVISKITNRRIRVVTYMSPFPAEYAKPVSVEKVCTASHIDAEWPLYVYDIFNDTTDDLEDNDDSLNVDESECRATALADSDDNTSAAL